jgi:hypothetical protein
MDRKQVRIFSIPGLLVLGVLVTGPAPAQPTVVDDGCGELRDVIVAQSSGALVPVDQPSLLRASPGKPVAPDPPQYCMDTAAAATAAFSSAMHAAGVAMSWGSAGAEEYCDSRSLSHCYPRLLNGDRATAGQLRFVQDAWSAVVAGITGVMPYGVASDMAVFERNALRWSISRRLHPDPQTVHGTDSGGHLE